MAYGYRADMYERQDQTYRNWRSTIMRLILSMPRARGIRMPKIFFAILILLGSIIGVSVLIFLTCIFCDWIIKAVEL